jgi:hypothetical protein
VLSREGFEPIPVAHRCLRLSSDTSASASFAAADEDGAMAQLLA